MKFLHYPDERDISWRFNCIKSFCAFNIYVVGLWNLIYLNYSLYFDLCVCRKKFWCICKKLNVSKIVCWNCLTKACYIALHLQNKPTLHFRVISRKFFVTRRVVNHLSFYCEKKFFVFPHLPVLLLPFLFYFILVFLCLL